MMWRSSGRVEGLGCLRKGVCEMTPRRKIFCVLSQRNSEGQSERSYQHLVFD